MPLAPTFDLHVAQFYKSLKIVIETQIIVQTKQLQENLHMFEIFRKRNQQRRSQNKADCKTATVEHMCRCSFRSNLCELKFCLFLVSGFLAVFQKPFVFVQDFLQFPFYSADLSLQHLAKHVDHFRTQKPGLMQSVRRPCASIGQSPGEHHQNLTYRDTGIL